jgi:hypothetical protein
VKKVISSYLEPINKNIGKWQRDAVRLARLAQRPAVTEGAGANHQKLVMLIAAVDEQIASIEAWLPTVTGAAGSSRVLDTQKALRTLRLSLDRHAAFRLNPSR